MHIGCGNAQETNANTKIHVRCRVHFIACMVPFFPMTFGPYRFPYLGLYCLYHLCLVTNFTLLNQNNTPLPSLLVDKYSLSIS